jgi:hypothetical protein
MSTVAVVAYVFAANHSNSCCTLNKTNQSVWCISCHGLTVLHGRFNLQLPSYILEFERNWTWSNRIYRIKCRMRTLMTWRWERAGHLDTVYGRKVICLFAPYVWKFLLAVSWNTNRKRHPSMLEILRVSLISMEATAADQISKWHFNDQALDAVTVIHPRWVETYWPTLRLRPWNQTA